MTLRARKSVPWREDPEIRARLLKVEPLALEGQTNLAIADALGVTEVTIRRDRKRLQELWLEQAGGEIKRRRLVRIAQLEEVHRKSMALAERHEAIMLAVLTGGDVDGKPLATSLDGMSVRLPDFKGQTAQLIKEARQALVDAAKIEGLVLEKVEHSGEIGVRREYVGVDVEEV